MKADGEKDPLPPSEESIQTKVQKPTSGLTEEQKKQMKLKLEKSIAAKNTDKKAAPPKKDMSQIIKEAILNAKKKKTESKPEPAPQAEKTLQ